MLMKTQRPQDLVFSLFGEYLLDRSGPVWVGSLIEMLAPFGVTAGATRNVLSRMSRKGWLRAQRIGRHGYYELSPRGRRLLEEGARRIYDPPRDVPWDGTWVLVTYTIPEELRSSRDRLRDRLLWLGCGSLGNGLWISPHDIVDPVWEAAEDLGIGDRVEVFRAAHAGFSDTARLVAQCWDLAAVQRRYERFIGTTNPLYLQASAAARRGELAPEDAFVRRFRLIHEYRDFPLVDPYLPRALLPEDWPGECAAWLFDHYRELLSEPADRHVDHVLVSAEEAVPA
jgi:phenylacetic acid degradation operon negative regulatory protein